MAPDVATRVALELCSPEVSPEVTEVLGRRAGGVALGVLAVQFAIRHGDASDAVCHPDLLTLRVYGDVPLAAVIARSRPDQCLFGLHSVSRRHGTDRCREVLSCRGASKPHWTVADELLSASWRWLRSGDYARQRRLGSALGVAADAVIPLVATCLTEHELGSLVALLETAVPFVPRRYVPRVADAVVQVQRREGEVPLRR